MAKKKEKRRSLLDRIRSLDTEDHPDGKDVGRLFQAIASGSIEEVLSLHNDRGVDLNALLDFKTTVHVAIGFEQMDCLKVLLEHGAGVMASYIKTHPATDKAMRFTDYENSALRLAAQLGNVTAMRLMLRCIRDRGQWEEENHLMARHIALLQAIESKNESIVVMLLKGYNHAKVCSDRTPLSKACESGDVQIAEKVLKTTPRNLINFLPVDLESECKFTPLEYACKGNHADIVDMLLRCGNLALLNNEYPKHAIDNSVNETALRPLSVALKYSSVDCADKLLSFVERERIRFCIPGACRDAVKHGHNDVLKRLLHMAASSADIVDENQNVTDENQNEVKTPSIINGYGETGPPAPLADKTTKTNKNKSNDNKNDKNVNKIVKEKKSTKTSECKPSKSHVDSVMPSSPALIGGLLTQKEAITVSMVTAARYNRIEVLKQLLSLGADVNSIAEVENPQLCDEPELDNVFYDLTGHRNERITALMAAASEGNLEVVRLLLDHRSNVNLATPPVLHRDGSRTVFPGGFTALMMAAFYGHPEVLTLLLKNGADVNARSRIGWTAMSLAMHEAQGRCIIPLLENGAEPNFGNFRGIQTLNKRWRDIYKAAGFRLVRDSLSHCDERVSSDGSSAPVWEACIPSLATCCKFFLRAYLQKIQPKKNLFHSVSNLHNLNPRMRNFLLNDIDLSKELHLNGVGSETEVEDDGEFRLIYYADFDQQTFKFWPDEPEKNSQIHRLVAM